MLTADKCVYQGVLRSFRGLVLGRHLGLLLACEQLGIVGRRVKNHTFQLPFLLGRAGTVGTQKRVNNILRGFPGLYIRFGIEMRPLVAVLGEYKAAPVAHAQGKEVLQRFASYVVKQIASVAKKENARSSKIRGVLKRLR